MRTLMMLPQKTPRTTRLDRCQMGTLKPQNSGKNWLYVMTHKTKACAAKAKSLKRTVVSGDAGWRYAYCDFISGENRKAQVEMVYEVKPSKLQSG